MWGGGSEGRWRDGGGVERGGEEGVKVGGEMEGELKGVGRREGKEGRKNLHHRRKIKFL